MPAAASCLQTTMPELLAAAVDYGNEIIDSEIRNDNVEIKYMDGQGVERRVGAKTRFIDVRRARVLRISKRLMPAGGVADEQAGLVGIARKKASGRPTRKPTREAIAAAANLEAASESRVSKDDMDEAPAWLTSAASEVLGDPTRAPASSGAT